MQALFLCLTGNSCSGHSPVVSVRASVSTYARDADQMDKKVKIATSRELQFAGSRFNSWSGS